MDCIDENQLLKYALDSGIINLANIRSEATMKKREEILEKHPNKIWQGKDGKWRTYIHAEGYPKNLKLICKTTKEALLDTLVSVYEEEDETDRDCTFSSAFKEWNTKRLADKLISMSSYRFYLDLFNQIFKNSDIANLLLSKSTVGVWQNFLEGVAPKCCYDTFTKVKTIVKGTLTRAKRNGYINHSINEIFETLEVSSRQFIKTERDDSEEVYTKEEVEKLEEYLISNKTLPNLGLLLLFVTGMRIGELVVLYKTDFLDDYSISVTKTLSKTVQNGKHIDYIKDSPKTESGRRKIPVPEEYHWLFDEIKFYFSDESIFAFKSFKGDGYICKLSYTNALLKACEKCSIKYKSLHKIRKTYCSSLLDENVNPKIVAKLAGHSSPSMTLKAYNKDRTSDSEKREMVDKVFKMM